MYLCAVAIHPGTLYIVYDGISVAHEPILIRHIRHLIISNTQGTPTSVVRYDDNVYLACARSRFCLPFTVPKCKVNSAWHSIHRLRWYQRFPRTYTHDLCRPPDHIRNAAYHYILRSIQKQCFQPGSRSQCCLPCHGRKREIYVQPEISLALHILATMVTAFSEGPWS